MRLQTYDIRMGDGRVVEIAEVLAFDGATEIDGRGYMVLQALIYAHLHPDETFWEHLTRP